MQKNLAHQPYYLTYKADPHIQGGNKSFSGPSKISYRFDHKSISKHIYYRKADFGPGLNS